MQQLLVDGDIALKPIQALVFIGNAIRAEVAKLHLGVEPVVTVVVFVVILVMRDDPGTLSQHRLVVLALADNLFAVGRVKQGEQQRVLDFSFAPVAAPQDIVHIGRKLEHAFPPACHAGSARLCRVISLEES